MRIKLVGDGCRYCNPQYYISLLERQTEDDQKDLETLSAENTAFRDLLARVVCTACDHGISLKRDFEDAGVELGSFELVLGKHDHG